MKVNIISDDEVEIEALGLTMRVQALKGSKEISLYSKDMQFTLYGADSAGLFDSRPEWRKKQDAKHAKMFKKVKV